MSTNIQLHNSKLFLLLRTLDKKERKQFALWLSSPFHNNSEKVVNLYRGLLTKHKGFDKPVSKTVLAGYIGISDSVSKNDELSPKENVVLRKVMTQLTIQVQEFLIWQQSKEDIIGKKRLLMNALLERKLYSLTSAVLTKSKKELAASPYQNTQYHEDAFKIAEVDFYLETLLFNRNPKTYIQQVIDTFLQSTIVTLLKYYCAAKSREEMVKIKCNYPLIGAVKEYVDKEIKEDAPIIYAYYMTLCLLEQKNKEHFIKSKKYIFKNINLFDAIDTRQFLNHLINYCTRSIKKGKDEFVQERQDLYELGLELDCWTTQLYFSTHQFVNIVSNTLLLKKTDRANNFIQQYQTQLSSDTRDDIINYCHALVAFQIKDYDKAQDYLIKINTAEDFSYHIHFKILIIKIYYEQEVLTLDNIDTHPINYELEAIRHYVMSKRNTKMSELLRESYNNFVNLFKRILNRKKKIINKESVNPKQLDKLKEELHTEIPLIERQWLKEKIEELRSI